MDICRPFHRPGIKMWRKLCAKHFGHGGNFLNFPYPPGATQRWLQDAGGPCTQHCAKFGLGAQPLTRGNRNAHRACHFSHACNVIGWGGFFEP